MFFCTGQIPVKVSRLEVATGKREAWKEFTPGDPAGVYGIAMLLPTADGSTYAFEYRRVLSELYLVDRLGVVPGI